MVRTLTARGLHGHRKNQKSMKNSKEHEKLHSSKSLIHCHHNQGGRPTKDKSPDPLHKLTRPFGCMTPIRDGNPVTLQQKPKNWWGQILIASRPIQKQKRGGATVNYQHGQPPTEARWRRSPLAIGHDDELAFGKNRHETKRKDKPHLTHEQINPKRPMMGLRLCRNCPRTFRVGYYYLFQNLL